MLDLLQTSRRMFRRPLAEEVVFLPGDGTERTLLATVNRNPIAPLSESGGLAYNIEVSVLNQAVDMNDEDGDGIGGIAISEIDPAISQLRLTADHEGGSSVDRPISRVIASDEGVIRLGVR